MPTNDIVYRIKKSQTEGNQPTSLTFGELAVNTADKSLFVGGPTSQVIKIISGGLDVSLTGVTANDLLFYSSSLSKWSNLHLGSGLSITSNTISTGISVKGSNGSIQFANGSDLQSENALEYDTGTQLFKVPGGIVLGASNPLSFIEFPDGSTMASANIAGGEF